MRCATVNVLATTWTDKPRMSNPASPTDEQPQMGPAPTDRYLQNEKNMPTVVNLFVVGWALGEYVWPLRVMVVRDHFSNHRLGMRKQPMLITVHFECR